MGSGTPVIASDIAPHLEVIGGSRPGARLFADGDLHSLVEALQFVDKDPVAELRAAAFDAPYIARRFDWDVAVDRLEAVYAGRSVSTPLRALETPRAASSLGFTLEKETAA